MNDNEMNANSLMRIARAMEQLVSITSAIEEQLRNQNRILHELDTRSR